MTKAGQALCGSLIGMAVAALPAAAEGPAHLVKDIDTSAAYTPGPDRIQAAGHNLFLAGNGFWMTDGTAAGTRRVPGLDGVAVTLFVTPVALGNALYFIGNDGGHGAELWRTDGTPAGTGIVKDIAPGRPGSRVQKPVEFRGALYFGADDGTHGYQLWKTDDAAGAVAVLDAPSVAGFAGLAAAVDRLFFLAGSSSAPGAPWDLYASDGTARGTVLLRTFRGEVPHGCYYEGCTGWPPGSFIELNGRAYFIASDGTSGLELWRTDGTPAGTVRVKDICPGACSGFLYSDGISFGDSPALQIVGGKLFFFADDGIHGMEPWTSDGTEQGTRLVRDIAPGPDGSTYGIEFTSDGDVAFFTATPQKSGLWRSDGTEAGTFEVAIPAPAGGPDRLISSSGSLFFVTGDRSQSVPLSLWRTDAAASPAVLLAANVYRASSVADWNGRLLYVGSDSDGIALWRSDGTLSGTARVALLVPAENASSLPVLTGALGNQLIFGARNGGSYPLWATDGSESATRPFSPVSPSSDLFASDPFSATYRGAIFFSGNDGSGRELWKTDGTADGTSLVRRVGHPGARFGWLTESVPSAFQVVDDLLYFQAFDGDHGFSLFRTDGTEAGTIYLVALARLGTMVSLAGSVYFGAFDESSHYGLWKTDGTPQGTSQVRALAAFSPIVFRGRLYFVGFEGDTSGSWTSDGTSEGTVLFLPSIGEIAATSGSLFLVDRGGYGGPPRLWRSDGTLPATLLAEFPQQSWPRSLIVAGDRLFFVAGDPDHGTELWTSDGTPAGTHPVKDIWPGPGDSWPQNLTAINGLLLFSARDPLHGDEIWRSDGTDAGTWMVQDVFPGTGASSPADFTLAGPTLFFTADDGRTGRELWAVPWAAVDPPPGRRPRSAPTVPWRR